MYRVVGTRIGVDNPVTFFYAMRCALWRQCYSLLKILNLRPDLHLLHTLCEQLNRSLAQAESSYLEFVDACNAAIKSCDEAAQICGHKANEVRDKKLTTRIVGGTASAVATGVGAVAATALTVSTGGLGALALGAAVGTVGAAGAVTTHRIASEYAKSEASFRSIRQEFDDLRTEAYTLLQAGRVTRS